MKAQEVPTMAKGIMKYQVPSVMGEYIIAAPLWWQPVAVTEDRTGPYINIWAEVDAPKQVDIERVIKVYAPSQTHGVTHHELFIGMVAADNGVNLFVYERGLAHE